MLHHNSTTDEIVEDRDSVTIEHL